MLNPISIMTLNPSLAFLSPEQMKQLYAVCKAKRMIWRELPNGSHNDTVAEPYFFDYISDFLREELENQ